MVQALSAAERDGSDSGVPLVNWREYAAIPRVGDYDDLVGDEPSVPIIYEPI